MSKLPGLSSDEGAARIAEGRVRIRFHAGKGQPCRAVSDRCERQDVAGDVPKRRDLPQGTLRAIIEPAGLTRTEFLELL